MNATAISNLLPFMEYELHTQLMNKLKLRSMNALFGLHIQISVGENMLLGLAVGGLFKLPISSAIQVFCCNTALKMCVCSVCYRSVSYSPPCTRGHSDCGEDSWWPEQWASHLDHPEKDQRHRSKEQRALSNKPSGETENTLVYSNWICGWHVLWWSRQILLYYARFSLLSRSLCTFSSTLQ